MNREQKRVLEKKLKEFGLNKDSIKAFLERGEIAEKGIKLWEGEKVRLNYMRIISNKDWPKLNPNYRNFVESNKNTIFTVEFDPIKKEKDSFDKDTLVQFVEDITDPKWLFFVWDLIPEPNQVNPNDIKVEINLDDEIKGTIDNAVLETLQREAHSIIQEKINQYNT